MEKQTTFEEMEVPQKLGTVSFRPTAESVRKLAFAVEDDKGWFLGDPVPPAEGELFLPPEGLVHPVFLANYLWWPEGFYVQEPGEIGHFGMWYKKYPHLMTTLLHAKTEAQFFNPFKIGKSLIADVTLIDRYEKRDKYFIVLEAMFRDEDGLDIARYTHSAMVGTKVPLRMEGLK